MQPPQLASNGASKPSLAVKEPEPSTEHTPQREHAGILVISQHAAGLNTLVICGTGLASRPGAMTATIMPGQQADIRGCEGEDEKSWVDESCERESCR